MNKIAELIIYPYLKEIMDASVKNNVILVKAPTGTGKSLGIPASFANIGLTVWCCAPTVSAVLALYRRLNDLGFKVGYAAESTKNYDEDTQIVYCTTGHLRRKLMKLYSKKGDISSYLPDILMIDEIHTGDMNTSSVMNILRMWTDRGVELPTIILASATPSKLLNFFPDKKIIDIPISGIPIEIAYRPECDNFTLFGSGIYSAVENIVSSTKGNLIVIVPGLEEIDTVYDILTYDEFGEESKEHIVYRAHSSIPTEELMLMFDRTPNGERKIIIGTNIVESSLTIEGIEVIIDCMREKRLKKTNGQARLALCYESKTSAIQRSGRTGRTCEGTCYRLCSQEFFESKLEDHRQEEIEVIDIANIILECIENGIDIVEFFKPFPKLENDVGITMNILEKFQLVDMNTRTVTKAGKFVASLPIGFRLGLTLFRILDSSKFFDEKTNIIIPKESSYTEILLLVACMCMIECNGPSYLWTPRKERGENKHTYEKRIREYKVEKFSKIIGKSDIETYLNIFVDIGEDLLSGDFKKFGKIAYGKSYNSKKLREFKSVLTSCFNTLFPRIKIPILVKNIDEISPLIMSSTVSVLTQSLAQVFGISKMYSVPHEMFVCDVIQPEMAFKVDQIGGTCNLDRTKQQQDVVLLGHRYIEKENDRVIAIATCIAVL